jgi:CrcB protein
MGLAENRGVCPLIAPTGQRSGRSIMRFLWVGLAGAAGAVARYTVGLAVDQSRLPWATLGINLSGALLLGFFLAVALGHLPVSVMTPVALGLIGGFTTFSTFAWEAFTLGKSGRPGPAAI